MTKEQRKEFADFQYKSKELLESLISLIQNYSDIFCDCETTRLSLFHKAECKTVKIRMDMEKKRDEYDKMCKAFALSMENEK